MNDFDPSLTPTVSVCCITYNQVEYIKDALDSFLMQKTSFPFEVIIHDDASTDGTVNILDDYKRRYPSVIKLIKQSDNQYKKGLKISKEFVWPIAKGEFIAICEGDDYWIDDAKLQKQFDAFKKYKEIDICFGYGYKRHEDKMMRRIGYYGCDVKLIELRDIIYKGGGSMPTASIMFRRSVVNIIPDWFNTAPVGDYYLQCFASSKGALYLPEAFCVYRVQAKNSWSSSFDTIKLDYLSKSIDSLNNLDEFYGLEYRAEIKSLRARAYYFVASSYLRTGDASSANKYFRIALAENENAPFIYKLKFLISCSKIFVSIYKYFYKS